MTTVWELQMVILGLSEAEYAELRGWLLDEDWERWEREFDEDVRAGKPDALASEALEAKAKGELRAQILRDYAMTDTDYNLFLRPQLLHGLADFRTEALGDIGRLKDVRVLVPYKRFQHRGCCGSFKRLALLGGKLGLVS